MNANSVSRMPSGGGKRGTGPDASVPDTFKPGNRRPASRRWRNDTILLSRRQAGIEAAE
jgi:hypothetical protein